jgi:hypothetical protein
LFLCGRSPFDSGSGDFFYYPLFAAVQAQTMLNKSGVETNEPSVWLHSGVHSHLIQIFVDVSVIGSRSTRGRVHMTSALYLSLQCWRKCT